MTKLRAADLRSDGHRVARHARGGAAGPGHGRGGAARAADGGERSVQPREQQARAAAGAAPGPARRRHGFIGLPADDCPKFVKGLVKSCIALVKVETKCSVDVNAMVGKMETSACDAPAHQGRRQVVQARPSRRDRRATGDREPDGEAARRAECCNTTFAAHLTTSVSRRDARAVIEASAGASNEIEGTPMRAITSAASALWSPCSPRWPQSPLSGAGPRRRSSWRRSARDPVLVPGRSVSTRSPTLVDFDPTPEPSRRATRSRRAEVAGCNKAVRRRSQVQRHAEPARRHRPRTRSAQTFVDSRGGAALPPERAGRARSARRRHQECGEPWARTTARICPRRSSRCASAILSNGLARSLRRAAGRARRGGAARPLRLRRRAARRRGRAGGGCGLPHCRRRAAALRERARERRARRGAPARAARGARQRAPASSSRWAL